MLRLPSLFVAALVACSAIGQAKRIAFYDSAAALDYAKQWCAGGNDCGSGTKGQFRTDNNTDCTHFMAHVLLAGGVKVEGVGFKCAKGLTARATELGEWFENASKDYVNVRAIARWQDTKAGDFAFATAFVFRPWQLQVGDNYRHAMLLAEPATAESVRVYSHTSDKCGDPTAHFDTGKGIYYRIDPSPLDGTWITSDSDGRFMLEVRGAQVKWTERRKPGDGETFTTNATLVESRLAEYRLDRVNDDETLRRIGFSDQQLRSRIVAAKPESSTLTLSWDGARCTAQWRGLSVRKNPDNSFKELLQPSVATPKLFELKRSK